MPTTQRIMPQIKHVVVLMMENRSFDNLLGWLYSDAGNQPPNNIPGRTPTTFDGLVANRYSNTTPNLGQVFATEGTTAWPNASPTTVPNPDPGESFDQMTQQILPDMSGFLKDYETIADSTAAGQIMQSYSPDQVPVISQLAKSFAVSDAWFGSAPCQTWPNRSFLHVGDSGKYVNNDDTYWGWNFNTIFDLLDQQKISWSVYSDTVAVPSLVKVMFRQFYINETNFGSMDDFYEACAVSADAPADRKIPTYTFLEPDFGVTGYDESYHPPDDISLGEAFLHKVYSNIQGCSYRDEILFVLTFDEHGGCYDHVQPPASTPLPANENGFAFDRFGPRVPTIVVSSYVQPGTVFRSTTDVPYDHTSILRTLQDWLPIDPQKFAEMLPSQRIVNAPNLASVLTETSPQDWPTIAAPSVAAANWAEMPLNDLHRSILHGATAADSKGRFNAEDVTRLETNVRTRGDAAGFFSSK